MCTYFFLLQWWKFINKCALFSWKCYSSNLWKIYNSLYVFFWFGGKTWLEYVFLYNDNRCCWYLCWDPDPSSKLQAEFSCFTLIGRLNSSMCTTSATPIRSTCRKRAEKTQMKCKNDCFSHILCIWLFSKEDSLLHFKLTMRQRSQWI